MGASFDDAPLAGVDAADGLCAADGHAVPLRFYTPAGAVAEGPVVLFAHGGGWVTGDLDSHDSFCRFLATHAGLRVASVDYRRSPEAVFPAALNDMRTAARWVASGLSPLGRADGLVLAGDSAGGGLAAALGARGKADGLDLRALLLLYPVLDLSRRAPSYAAFAEGHLLTADDMAYFIASYAPDPGRRSDPDCSPLLGVAAASLPPVVVLTCSHDVLRDEGRAYVEACRAAGVVVRHVEAAGHVHGIATLRKVIPSGIPHLERAIGELREIST
nr:alpha/beta hydrolase fold domain-containing protein [Sphingomonas colocasiae]